MSLTKSRLTDGPIIVIVGNMLTRIASTVQQLGARGFQILFASTRQEATRVVRRVSPRLIMLNRRSVNANEFNAWRRMYRRTRDVKSPLVVILGASQFLVAQDALGDFASIIKDLMRRHPKSKQTDRGVATRGEQQATTEDALHSNDEQWRTVFENNPTMCFMVAANGTILAVNPFGAEQLGYEVSELIGCQLLSVFYEPDRDAVASNFAACLAHLGQPMTWEFRKIRKDGSVLWVRESAKAVSRHNVPVVLVVCEDITLRKRAEDELKHSEEKYELMFRSIPDAIGLCELGNRRFIEVNPGFARITGYPAQEVLGQTTDDLNLFVDTVKHGELLERLLRDGDAQAEVIRFRTKRGETRVGRVSAAQVVVGSQPCVLCVTRDITDQKLAEEKLHLSEALLAEGQKISHTGSWGLNLPTGKLVWSDEYYRILGLEPGAVEPDIEFFWSRIDPDDRKSTRHTIASAILERTGFECEFRVALPDGSIKYLHSVGHPLTRDGEDTDEYVGTVIDITGRKMAEAEHEARRAADAESRAKSELLAHMSHELRTPLNVILGYTQILLRGATPENPQRESLRAIQQSGQHLLNLLNNTLDYAGIEAGRLDLRISNIVLANLFETVAEIIGVKAEQKGLAFVCDLGPGLPCGIRADETRLRQILINLLSNAVDFTDSGEVCLHVAISPAGTLRFEVRDTGVGIAAHQLQAMFEPFGLTSEPQWRPGGAGLGLAISRQLVQSMGGEIQVVSQPGHGSTFWFELNVPMNVVGEALSGARKITGYSGARRKILVVEEFPEDSSNVTQALASLGFEVTRTPSTQALEKAKAIMPDLVLVESAANGIVRPRTVRTLRKRAGLVTTPIIAVSNHSSSNVERNDVAAAVDTVIPKPVDLCHLLAQIEVLLGLTWTADPIHGYRPRASSRKPLAIPPVDEMETLRELAQRGNMRDIMQWAQKIGECNVAYRPFVEKIYELAREYESNAILSMVERPERGEM
ncbi:hypothetical protein AYM40_07120 [Paraburkholderia phytofirmans OLGA172]|uniref:Virulence sensor protein BvgS n=1 Tax=Paraburkholderia phytofirmans OLGA172 TaxID=1417228 RepID=A0A160FIT4_9BURK|nr:PAS domain-containing hybrid sensor histidine kinase/response regulator [Paraburkholderia phytofirmans]ANB72161.1 hypothetical protein AYM40_07120 [Paraburkholderia phytofirmans OLGA172]